MKKSMTSDSQENPVPLNVAASEQWVPSTSLPSLSDKVSIHSVCVYCGSSSRVAQRYKDNANALGAMLAKQGLDIIYGGGRVGLMGIVADAAMNAGGKVIGIIPKHIQALEVEHHGLTELRG
jgi:predicted Rossmann-fold nucleotide-binding protein